MNGFETIMEKDTLASLDNYGLIKVSGDDAQDFLHKQFTNDLTAGVDEDHSQINAYCSPKGRVLALFRVYMDQGDYYLITPRTVIEATLKRLRMFVLMSKVSFDDVSDSMQQLGISGLNSADKLKMLFNELPETINAVSHNNNISIISLPGKEPRFLLIGSDTEIAELKTKLSSEMVEVSTSAWELLDIHAGQAVIHRDNVEAFVPQMINLQAIDGLSFKKGCYPGQEIVARMQYLGKLKRRMYLAHSEQIVIPQPGDEIYSYTPEKHKVGVVVIAQESNLGGCELLMVTEIEATESQKLYLSEEQENPLQTAALPYALEP